MLYEEVLLNDLKIRDDILRHYDFAFKLNWSNLHHQTIFMYIKSLTMYIRIKGFIHCGSAGIFYGIRFNDTDRLHVETHVSKFRKLFENESVDTFREDNINGCCVFTL